MRLSRNEVRARAAAFVNQWRDAAYEKGETQSFYNTFFEVFGVRRRSVARYEEHVAKLDNRSGYIDLFWPGVLIVEQRRRRSRCGVLQHIAVGRCERHPEPLRIFRPPARARPGWNRHCEAHSFSSAMRAGACRDNGKSV